MAAFVRSHGKAFRPHGKTHKCPEVAKALIKAGPRGSRPRSADIRKKASELLDLVQLPGLQDRFPAHLAGGPPPRSRGRGGGGGPAAAVACAPAGAVRTGRPGRP